MSNQEKAPISDDRLRVVARWIQDNYRPVLRTLTEAEPVELEDEPVNEFEIREYQLEAWTSVWDARHQGQKRALVHLATGLGKTSVAVFDVIKFREECLSQEPATDPRILFVSHMNDISEQAEERFTHYIPELDTAFFDTQKAMPDTSATFATFQSIYSQLDRFDPKLFDYIIYDEAHHSEAETFRAVREHFDPSFELALTATPDRTDEQDIREYFGNPVYSKGLPEAIAEGWLADVDYHIVFDDIVKQLMDEGFDPTTLKDFHELFTVHPRNEVIARNILEERNKIGLDTAKTIVFCEDMAHAEEMAELLGGVAYHSGIKKAERKTILKDFRTDANQVICTVDMFNEGVDIPDARLIVFLRSTQSGIIFEQQLGRGLRKTIGKNKVSILDFVANIERIQKVRELSKSIKDNTPGGMQGEGYITDDEGNNILESSETEGGLRIFSQHGYFDFDRLAVDLLKKWGELKSMSDIPDNLVSINSVAVALGVGHPMIVEIVTELGWQLPEFRFGSFYGRGVSPEQFELIKNHPYIKSSHEFLSISDARDEYGVHDITLNKMVDAMGWELPSRKTGSRNKRTRAISRVQMNELREKFPDNFLDQMPPGFMSVREASSELKMGKRTIARIIQEEGWQLPRYKSRGGPATDALSPFQIHELIRRRDSAS